MSVWGKKGEICWQLLEKNPTNLPMLANLREPGMRCSQELLGTCLKRYGKGRWDGVKDCPHVHVLDKFSKLPKALEGRNGLMALGWFHTQGRA